MFKLAHVTSGATLQRDIDRGKAKRTQLVATEYAGEDCGDGFFHRRHSAFGLDTKTLQTSAMYLVKRVNFGFRILESGRLLL